MQNATGNHSAIPAASVEFHGQIRMGVGLMSAVMASHSRGTFAVPIFGEKIIESTAKAVELVVERVGLGPSMVLRVRHL